LNPNKMELTFDISEFLFHEAELLDGRKYKEWLDILTDDVTYDMPIQINRELGQDQTISYKMEHYSETRHTLEMRVKRFGSAYVWAENPPSRTRHFVSNIRVKPLNETEVEVRSYFLLYRSRGTTGDIELVSGERTDLLRSGDGKWKIAKRMIMVDEATLGVRNLAILL
jgi:3-phenylpropionate/cinnamic acid dioxygenase small subunit